MIAHGVGATVFMGDTLDRSDLSPIYPVWTVDFAGQHLLNATLYSCIGYSAPRLSRTVSIPKRFRDRDASRVVAPHDRKFVRR
jgi:hypothetical protein